MHDPACRGQEPIDSNPQRVGPPRRSDHGEGRHAGPEHRQEEQETKVNSVLNDVEKLHAFANNLTEQNNKLERMVNGLITSVSSSFSINKRVIEYIETIKKEINNLSKAQQIINKQLINIEEKTKNTEPLKNDMIIEDKTSPIELTDTEKQIIQFLLNEGSKAAPEVEKKIEKTREHTARLMKKLWQEGFIERDTHRIPFIYRVNDKLKEELKTKT